MMPRGVRATRCVGEAIAAVRRSASPSPPRLGCVFNVQGSELIFLLLVALIILGPEKLPDAVRRATKTYAEFKKMASGFQGEMRQVLDEPMRELRETANAVRDAASFDITATGDSPATAQAAPTAGDQAAVSEIAPRPSTPVRREPGLNFGSANPRRQERTVRADDQPAAADQPVTPAAPAAPEAAAAATDAPADTGSAEGDTTE